MQIWPKNQSWMTKLAAALAIGLTAMVTATDAVDAQDQELSIIFVGCGPTDGFHGHIFRGSVQAADDLDVDVSYVYPDRLTIPNQIEKIEEAIAAGADGIAICVYAEDKHYAEVVARARQAGIAIASSAAPPQGSSLRDPDDIFLFRTGSDERAAGQMTANRLLEMGVTERVLVGQQRPADVTCRARAESQIETLRAAGIDADLVELTPDPIQQAEALVAYLRDHPDTQAATSICDEIDGFLAGKATSGRDDLILTGYDILSQSLDAIRDGRQAFTIDQQQFWRGYMPVLLLTHYLRYALKPVINFLTGPQIVDASNVDEIEALVELGIR